MNENVQYVLISSKLFRNIPYAKTRLSQELNDTYSKLVAAILGGKMFGGSIVGGQ